MSSSTDLIYGNTFFGSMFLQPFQILIIFQQIAFVRGNDLWTGSEYRLIFCQFCVDRIEILNRISSFASGNIDNMNQQTASLDMTKKIMPQARAFRRAFNDARDICHNKAAAFINIDDTEIGKKCRKMIIRDFGMCFADNRQQC